MSETYVFCVLQWMAMNVPKIAIYVDTLRECYEAFVIYSFMKYLLNFLFYEMDAEVTIDCKPGVKHLFPLCFLPTCVGGRRFLNRCKHGHPSHYHLFSAVCILQSLKCVTNLNICRFFEILGVYGEGHYSPGYAYPYLLVINNISQMVCFN